MHKAPHAITATQYNLAFSDIFTLFFRSVLMIGRIAQKV
jgi:hypothetical protein